MNGQTIHSGTWATLSHHLLVPSSSIRNWKVSLFGLPHRSRTSLLLFVHRANTQAPRPSHYDLSPGVVVDLPTSLLAPTQAQSSPHPAARGSHTKFPTKEGGHSDTGTCWHLRGAVIPLHQMWPSVASYFYLKYFYNPQRRLSTKK